MANPTLAEQSRPFLDEIERWQQNLPAMPLAQAIPDALKTAIISVDVINGFCYEGPLASPRVAGIVEPIRALFVAAWERGVRQIVLSQDTHDPQAVEFAQWPPHCVRGTPESQTVPALAELPFADQMLVLPKNSIDSSMNTGLEAWLSDHLDLDTFIVAGDCTDLCTYQLAMFLRLRANAKQLQQRVIVPANAVDTYDLPVEAARAAGILPHPGDVLHALFLYHMAVNGVEVVKEITG
jgi:nicotinamidase-related amidase